MVLDTILIQNLPEMTVLIYVTVPIQLHSFVSVSYREILPTVNTKIFWTKHFKGYIVAFLECTRSMERTL